MQAVAGFCLQEDLDVRKDTERAEEIRAMKKAWEDAQPGRAAKALQSRLQYLSTHMVKVPGADDESTQQSISRDDGLQAISDPTMTDRTLSPIPATVALPDPNDQDAVLSNEPPPPPMPKEVLPPIDLDPYRR